MPEDNSVYNLLLGSYLLSRTPIGFYMDSFGLLI